MGSQQSGSTEKGNRELIANHPNKTDAHSSGFNIRDTYSSYQGIENNESKEKSEVSSHAYEGGESKSESHKDSNLVNTPFLWKEEGNEVFLTGSFANWNHRFLMKKSGNEHILNLVCQNY